MRSQWNTSLKWWPPTVFGLVNGTALALLFWGGQYRPSGQSAVPIGAVPLFTMVIGYAISFAVAKKYFSCQRRPYGQFCTSRFSGAP